MRLNQYIASISGYSRRKADSLIANGEVTVNGDKAFVGQQIVENDRIAINGQLLNEVKKLYLVLNKPVGYVCSREGQGSQTIYELLPKEFHSLKYAGRLDKQSSGLLLLTNDGQYLNLLTHPNHQKLKIYEVKLNKNLSKEDCRKISDEGVELDDGPSKFKIKVHHNLVIAFLYEGRKRQIRRTFRQLGYEVIDLKRTSFGPYKLGDLQSGNYKFVVKLKV